MAKGSAVRYQLVIEGPSGPLPCGPREWEEPPEIGTRFWETVEGRRLHLEIAAVQQLPVVPGGTFKHDEVWIVCRLLTG